MRSAARAPDVCHAVRADCSQLELLEAFHVLGRRNDSCWATFRSTFELPSTFRGSTGSRRVALAHHGHHDLALIPSATSRCFSDHGCILIRAPKPTQIGALLAREYLLERPAQDLAALRYSIWILGLQPRVPSVTNDLVGADYVPTRRFRAFAGVSSSPPSRSASMLESPSASCRSISSSSLSQSSSKEPSASIATGRSRSSSRSPPRCDSEARLLRSCMHLHRYCS